MQVWHLWTIAGIGLILAEIFTPGFVVFGIGLACLGSALASFLGAGTILQIIVFCAANLLFFFGVRSLFVKWFYRFDDPRPTGISALIGQTALVTETIESSTSPGRIKLGGDDWRARPVDDVPITRGSAVKIIRIEGVTAVVEPMEPVDPAGD